MNYKNFSTDIWNQIESTVNRLKKQNQKLIAAFDADGTLWDTDLGENFFQYQIDNHQCKFPQNPFDHYLEMKKINNDPRSAYVWLAQINAGHKLETVQKWAQDAFNTIQPRPIFSEQKKLIDYLKENGVDIYIVTASIKWAVEPGALALGLTVDQVIGVSTKVVDGVITDTPILPITYKQGKVDALLSISQQIKPFLASGNTMGDFELLQSATDLRLAVSAASRDDKLFKTEFELQQKAIENNWLSHRFI